MINDLILDLRPANSFYVVQTELNEMMKKYKFQN